MKSILFVLGVKGSGISGMGMEFQFSDCQFHAHLLPLLMCNMCIVE